MTNIERFNNLAGFYEYMKTVQSVICVSKGGIALENYVGRFFAADVLELIVMYADKIGPVPGPMKARVAQYRKEFEFAKTFATPSEKPIYKMSLDEFEKMMNI
ncbi:MAG: hypothetical protein FWC51_01280 [Proteobacteria bacterium]|nr:hypothetical protein [Pseudomonadota bacterium]